MRWKIALAVLLTAAPLALRAQDDAVFGEEDIWKLYTTLSASLTQVDGGDSALLGLNIGTILEDQWRFGVAARTSVDSTTSDSGELSFDTWDYWDLGGEFGYIFAPASLVHADLSLFVGGGRIEDDGGDSTDFMVVEPAIAACLNLHETWELGVRLGWRFTDGFEYGRLDDGDLTEPVYSIFVRATEF